MIYLLCALVNFSSAAPTLQEQFLKRLSAARSIAEIERVNGSYERLRIARTACEIQLKEKALPAACYEVLVIEKQIPVHSSTPSVEKLDRLCSLAAEKRTDLSPPDPNLSASCAKAVREMREIHAYQAEDHPDWSGN